MAAERRPRAATEEGEEHQRRETDASLGRPQWTDLRRRDAKEEEGAAPDGTEHEEDPQVRARDPARDPRAGRCHAPSMKGTPRRHVGRCARSAYVV